MTSVTRRREASHPATPTSARNSPAIGLAREQTAARLMASVSRSRCAASRAPRPIATPSAKVSRPVKRFVALAAPNQIAPSRACEPQRGYVRRSNRTAAATAESAPTRRGPKTEASGGKSTL